MLLILIYWIIIFFILFSSGEIFLHLYNIINHKNKEKYSVTEIFILGTCFILIPLSLISLWFPCNHYVLTLFTIIAFLYWGLNRIKLKRHIQSAKHIYHTLSKNQIIAVVLFIFIIVLYLLLPEPFYDATYYHQQQIRWIAEYPTVPGLANLEDRYGFNSNYLLLSALFSLRFFSENILYAIQSLFFVLLLINTLIRLFTSGYNIKYVILLTVFCILFILSGWYFKDSNTDIIPLLFIFYYIVKTTLSPNWLKEQPLLACLLPITLITFKVSVAVFAIACLIPAIHLIKKKNAKKIIFIVSTSFLIVGLWLIRNVITSGYLIYPLPLDLFSFDWKVPMGVLLLEKEHVEAWARYSFSIDWYYDTSPSSMDLLKYYFNNFLLIVILLSPLLFIYCKIKKHAINNNTLIIYLISVLGIVFTLLEAPGFRFMNGYIFGCLFIILFIYLALINKENFHIPHRYRNFIVLGCFAVVLANISKESLIIKDQLHEENIKIKSLYLTPVIVQPPLSLSKYLLNNNIEIYTTDKLPYQTYDNLPVTNAKGIPAYPFDGYKIQNITTIEARGNSLADGFRTKKEYVNIINNNFEKYKTEYYRLKYKK